MLNVKPQYIVGPRPIYLLYWCPAHTCSWSPSRCTPTCSRSFNFNNSNFKTTFNTFLFNFTITHDKFVSSDHTYDEGWALFEVKIGNFTLSFIYSQLSKSTRSETEYYSRHTSRQTEHLQTDYQQTEHYGNVLTCVL